MITSMIFKSLIERARNTFAKRTAAMAATDRHREDQQLALGVGLFQAGDLKRAEEVLRHIQYHSSEVSHCQVHYILGIIAAQTGRLEDAEILCEKAVAVDGKDTNALCALGSIKASLGKLDEAELFYRRAVEANEHEPNSLRALGGVKEALGKLDEAEILYGKALAINGNEPNVLYALGNLKASLGKLDEAETLCAKALAIKENEPNFLHALGCVKAALGKLSDAEILCEKALAFIENEPGFLHALGGIKASLGKLDEAETHYEKALPNNEDKPGFLRVLGGIKASLGKLNEAESFYEKALAINEDDSTILYALGSIKASLGKLEDANRIFTRDLPVQLGNGGITSSRVLCFDNETSGSANLSMLNQKYSRLISWWQGETCWQASRAIYFVAADSVYFCRYAKVLLTSVRKNGGSDIHIHLHIINPSDEALNFAREISGRTGISVSTENLDLMRFDETQRKTYYACSRYLILPEIVKRSGSSPIIVADIDQLVMADIDPLLALIGDADVGLLRFISQCNNLLSFVSATIMAVNTRASGLSFVDHLCRNVAGALLDPAHIQWHLDQGALAMTLLANPEIRYAFIPPAMIHLAQGEPPGHRSANEGIFWSITNSVKQNLTKLSTKSFRSLEEDQFGNR